MWNRKGPGTLSCVQCYDDIGSRLERLVQGIPPVALKRLVNQISIWDRFSLRKAGKQQSSSAVAPNQFAHNVAGAVDERRYSVIQ